MILYFGTTEMNGKRIIEKTFIKGPVLLSEKMPADNFSNKTIFRFELDESFVDQKENGQLFVKNDLSIKNCDIFV